MVSVYSVAVEALECYNYLRNIINSSQPDSVLETCHEKHLCVAIIEVEAFKASNPQINEAIEKSAGNDSDLNQAVTFNFSDSLAFQGMVENRTN